MEDKIHSGMDVSCTLDNLNRLTDAQQVTWNGSSISSESRQQVWPLDQVGYWEMGKLVLNGDYAWGGANEFNDNRTFKVGIELTGHVLYERSY